MEQIKSTMIAVCNQPVMETHSAIFLEIFVIPAAAVLSFSLTTATIYDCLVGTSICERAILAKYNAIVNGSWSKCNKYNQNIRGYMCKYHCIYQTYFICKFCSYEKRKSSQNACNRENM